MLSTRIIHRQDQCFALSINCPDTEVFRASVSTLKAMIPPSLRFFDFRMRYWVLSPEAEEQLVAFVSRMQALFSIDVEYLSETDEERESRAASARADQQERQQAEDEGARETGNRSRLRVAAQWDIESAYGALYLAPGAPLEVIQAVYRTLAKLHHPDVGGSTELMAEINDAYNYLLETLKKSVNVA